MKVFNLYYYCIFLKMTYVCRLYYNYGYYEQFKDYGGSSSTPSMIATWTKFGMKRICIDYQHQRCGICILRLEQYGNIHLKVTENSPIYSPLVLVMYYCSCLSVINNSYMKIFISYLVCIYISSSGPHQCTSDIIRYRPTNNKIII